MNAKRKFRKYGWHIAVVVVAILLVVALLIADHYNLLPRKTYTAEHFGIETIHSSVDFNGNGTDDYTDLLLGARGMPRIIRVTGGFKMADSVDRTVTDTE